MLSNKDIVKTSYTDHEIKIVYDYWTNPNQKLSDIGKKHQVSQGKVSNLITQFLKLCNDARQEILNKKTRG